MHKTIGLKNIVLISTLIGVLGLPTYGKAINPLKVFILAGQSNMEGHAKVRTFDYIGDDPATAYLLKEMVHLTVSPKSAKTFGSPT